MNILLRILLPSLLFSSAGLAQDSSYIQKLARSTDFYLSGAGFYQAKIPGTTIPIVLPDYIKQNRLIYNSTFNPTWNNAQDNPLFHSAYYLGTNIKVKVADGFTIFGSFIGELRGFSYGSNSTRNIIFYPQLKAAINKSYPFLGKRLRLFGSIGNQLNPELYEGLTIYNLYQTGHDYKIRYGKFQINYVQLNDLVNGVGLNIDDSYDVITSFEELRLDSTWQMDVRFGATYLPVTFPRLRNTYIGNFSIGFYNRNFRFYAQAGLRQNREQVYTTREPAAALAGIKFTKRSKRLRIETVTEFRYYGAGFNAGYKNENVQYRDPARSPRYANSIGNHLYMLPLFERPFSAWSVFTEYQRGNQYKSVSAAILRCKASVAIYKKMYLKTDLDFNYLFAENEKPFLYPFYYAGIAWEPLEGNYLMLGASNKGMNLDMHYPTFYLFEKPMFMLTLKRDLPAGWWEGNR